MALQSPNPPHFKPRGIEVIKPGKFLGVPLWLGDLVARKKSHEDTRAQRFHKENQLKKTSPKKRSSGTS